MNELTDGQGIDVLVNNAGYGLIGPLLDVSDEQMRAQFDTNVFGLMAVTRAFVPGMVAQRRGRIVNVGSIAGRVAMPFMGAYNASKFAVEALSDALRMELQPFGIDVSIIEPGPIATAFSSASMGLVGGLDAQRSLYAPILADADKLHHGADRFNSPVEVVVRAIHEAAIDDDPRARYVVPGSMKPGDLGGEGDADALARRHLPSRAGPHGEEARGVRVGCLLARWWHQAGRVEDAAERLTGGAGHLVEGGACRASSRPARRPAAPARHAPAP